MARALPGRARAAGGLKGRAGVAGPEGGVGAAASSVEPAVLRIPWGNVQGDCWRPGLCSGGSPIRNRTCSEARRLRWARKALWIWIADSFS